MKSYVAVFICLFSLTVAAQQPAPPKAPAAPAPPAPAGATAAASPAPPRPELDPLRGQVVNIRLDVSVSDQGEGTPSAPKTLMVMLADRAMGRTRGAFEDRSISVDATPRIVDGRIRVQLTVESRAQTAPGREAPNLTLFWQNSFALLLDSGKPMLAFETSDPVTKRKLSIEVKATIQK
jgi:hypothetical protein